MTEYFFKLRVKNLGKNGRKIISPDIRQSCYYPVVVLGQIIYSVIFLFLFQCSPDLSPLKITPVPVSLEFLVLMALLVNTQISILICSAACCCCQGSHDMLLSSM